MFSYWRPERDLRRGQGDVVQLDLIDRPLERIAAAGVVTADLQEASRPD